MRLIDEIEQIPDSDFIFALVVFDNHSRFVFRSNVRDIHLSERIVCTESCSDL